jgi:hypothetical protein
VGNDEMRVPWDVQLGTVNRAGWNGSVAWPVLRIAGPVGRSLADAVRDCPDEAARVKLANVVVGAVLRTLEVAHAAGIIHCDVRPANIVLVIDPRSRAVTAYLVDWGLSHNAGDNAVHHGVPAYAAPGVFSNASSYDARPAMDVCGALCTWIAIVHGGASVEVPWLIATADGMIAEVRRQWLDENSKLVGVAAVLRAKVVNDRLAAEAAVPYTFEVVVDDAEDDAKTDDDGDGDGDSDSDDDA